MFIGYSLSDDYVLRLLIRNNNIRTLLGDGPHFLISSTNKEDLPDSVHLVKYESEVGPDHRGSIRILEDISEVRKSRKDFVNVKPTRQENKQTEQPTTHLLLDIHANGQYSTSQSLTVNSDKIQDLEFIIGTGYTDDEIAGHQFTDMHDLLVALLCFDKILAPLGKVAQIHELLGSSIFWRLVRDGVLSFIHWVQSPAIFYQKKGSISGGKLLTIARPENPQVVIEGIVSSLLIAAPGFEREAQKDFAILRASTLILDTPEEGKIDEVTNDFLQRPRIRRLLGVSEGTPLNFISRWQMFPSLRLTKLVQVAAASKALGISSTKLDFGNEELASQIFSTHVGKEYVDEVASYIIGGRYSINLSRIFQDRNLLDKILEFRDLQKGENLRREIGRALASSKAADIVSSVNGALKETISKSVLDDAQKVFSNISIPVVGHLPMIWDVDRKAGKTSLEGWLEASRKVFLRTCEELGLRGNDQCPCGSGEKIKNCCRAVLS